MKVYIDMDNTISNAGDFSTLFSDPQFFISQEPLQENITWILENFSNSNELYILSAVPATLKKAIQQKNQWLNRHFPYVEKNDRLYVITHNGHADKSRIADARNNILIDDSLQNLEKWRNAGGIAIDINMKEVYNHHE